MTDTTDRPTETTNPIGSKCPDASPLLDLPRTMERIEELDAPDDHYQRASNLSEALGIAEVLARNLIPEVRRLRAALTTDRDALIAANIEETARADSEKQRADSAEKEAKELRDRIFPPVKSVVITAPMAPALSIQELCAPIAANLSPEQSAEAENGTTAFGREYWEGRGK